MFCSLHNVFDYALSPQILLCVLCDPWHIYCIIFLKSKLFWETFPKGFELEVVTCIRFDNNRHTTKILYHWVKNQIENGKVENYIFKDFKKYSSVLFLLKYLSSTVAHCIHSLLPVHLLLSWFSCALVC